MQKIIYIIALATCITGCAFGGASSEKIVEEYNLRQENLYLPTRAEFEKYSNGSERMTFGIWAGTVGITALNQDSEDLVFQSLEKECGYIKENFKEVRVVSHQAPIWYEVWVFNDEHIERADKTSGTSAIFEYIDKQDITKFEFIGCGS